MSNGDRGKFEPVGLIGTGFAIGIMAGMFATGLLLVAERKPSAPDSYQLIFSPKGETFLLDQHGGFVWRLAASEWQQLLTPEQRESHARIEALIQSVDGAKTAEDKARK